MSSKSSSNDQVEYETTTELRIDSIDDPCWINISKYRNLITLDCSYLNLGTLPDNLPSQLKELYCSNNLLMSLSDNLPSINKNDVSE